MQVTGTTEIDKKEQQSFSSFLSIFAILFNQILKGLKSYKKTLQKSSCDLLHRFHLSFY